MDLNTYRGLDLERHPHGVLLVTINRYPERLNPADEVLHEAFGQIWLDVERDPETRVVVITGKGKAFSAGGDLDEQHALVGNFTKAVGSMNQARNVVVNMIGCGKPIISAINGPAAGMGLTVALLADIPLMAAEAKFTDAHVRLGMAAGDHAALLWPLACGMAKAKYYLMTADLIDAQEAERMGLVAKVFPRDELLGEALALAERLATGPQAAIQFTKRSLNHWLRAAQPIFEVSLAYEILNLFGEDIKEGLSAFAEKRPTAFA